MDRMKNELMLLGVATLILLSFEQDIQRICGAPLYMYSKISLLHHVTSCMHAHCRSRGQRLPRRS